MIMAGNLDDRCSKLIWIFGIISMACVMDKLAVLFPVIGLPVRCLFSRVPFVQRANAQMDALSCRPVTGVILMGVRVPPHALH